MRHARTIRSNPCSSARIARQLYDQTQWRLTDENIYGTRNTQGTKLAPDLEQIFFHSVFHNALPVVASSLAAVMPGGDRTGNSRWSQR